MSKICFRVLLFAVVCFGHSIVFAQSLECSKLRATGNPEYPPYLFSDPNDQDKLLGANALIMDMLAEKLGVDIEVVNIGPWSRAQKEVREGIT